MGLQFFFIGPDKVLNIILLRSNGAKNTRGAAPPTTAVSWFEMVKDIVLYEFFLQKLV